MATNTRSRSTAPGSSAAGAVPEEPDFKFPENMTSQELMDMCEAIKASPEYKSCIAKKNRNLDEEEKEAREAYMSHFAELQRRDSMATLDGNFDSKIAAGLAGFNSRFQEVHKVQKELDTLKAKQEVEQRDPLPGADQFKGLNEKENTHVASKRMFEMMDKCDEFLFNTETVVKKVRKFNEANLPNSLQDEAEEILEQAEKCLEEGRKYCKARAKIANIALNKTWTVAQKFDKNALVDGEDEEKRLAHAEKEASKEKTAANLKTNKNEWKGKKPYFGRGKITCHTCGKTGHIS